MARPLINSTINRLYRSYSERLIETFGHRGVFIVVTETKANCPNCGLDSANKCSNGKYNGTGPTPFTTKVCPVCKGNYFILTVKQHKIVCNFKWGKVLPTGDRPLFPGQLPVGFLHCKTYLKYRPLLEKATYFLVDGIRCSRSTHPIPRGLQDYVRTDMILKRDD